MNLWHNLNNNELFKVMHNGEPIERVNKKKILGIHFDENLSWSYHVNNVTQSSYATLRSLRQFKRFTPYKLLTVCSYHITYAFPNESTLYSCLSIKELLARSSHEIWSLSDSNGTRTHNHLVCKRTLNHLAKLAKWLSSIVSTYL